MGIASEIMQECNFRMPRRGASRPHAQGRREVMHYEPDTLWGRTVRGDREIARPSSGLSLVQRRLLKKLAQPRAFATLAAASRIEVLKLEQELVRLAELELVAFQRPGSPQPRTAPRTPRIELGMPLAGTSGPWRPPLPVYCAAAAFGIGVVLLFCV
jgi:hypothetical protein